MMPCLTGIAPHEKQYELERQNEALKAEVDDIKRRLAALEEKTA